MAIEIITMLCLIYALTCTYMYMYTKSVSMMMSYAMSISQWSP